MVKGVVDEFDDKLLSIVARRMKEDPIKEAILLELSKRGFVEMAEVYRRIKVDHKVNYSKFSVRIRTLVNGELIRKVKPRRCGIGNRAFVELTEKGKRVVELLKRLEES